MTSMSDATCDARVRVLSYNLNLLPRGCGGFQRERLQTFVDAVDAYDVLLLQEVYATSVLPYALQPLFCYQAALLSSLQEKGFAYHVVARQPSYWTVLKHGITCDSGLVIASRYPIVRSGSYTFRTHATIKQAAPKGCLVAEVRVPCELASSARNNNDHRRDDGKCVSAATSTSMLFFNVHMRPEEAVTAADSSQVQQMRIFVETLLQHTRRSAGSSSNSSSGGSSRDSSGNKASRAAAATATGGGETTTARVPFVVAGDFNIQGIDARTHAPTRQFSEFASEMQLLGDVRDVLYEACGRHPPTRPAHLFFPAQSQLTPFDALPRRQDYFLVNAAAVTACEARVEKFVVGHYRPYAYLSDHFGIATTLCVSVASDTPTSRVAAAAAATTAGADTGFVAARPSSRHAKTTTTTAMMGAAEVVTVTRRARVAAATAVATTHRRATPSPLTRVMTGVLLALIGVALTVSVTPLLLFVALWCALQWRWLLLQRTPVRRRFARVSDDVVRGTAEVDLLPLDDDDDDDEDDKSRDDDDGSNSKQRNGSRTSATAATTATQEDDDDDDVELLRMLPGVDSIATGWESVVRRCRAMPCLGATGDVGEAEWQSYGTVDSRARDVGAALTQLGLTPGGLVAVVGDACRNAVIVELACALYGFATLPLAGKGSTVRALLDGHAVHVAFADRAALASLLLCRSTALETVVCLHPIVDDDDAATAKDLNIALLTFAALEHRGRAHGGVAAVSTSSATATPSQSLPPSSQLQRPTAQSVLTRTMDNTATVDVAQRVVAWTHGDVLREVRVLQRTGVLPRGPWRELMVWCTPFAVLFHRICVLGLLLQGNAVATAHAAHLQAALRTFRPTLLVLSPLQFATSRLQLRRAQRQRTRTLYHVLFDRVFALRARLLRLGNTDCPLLRYVFFRRFARQLGGSVRTVVLSVSHVSTSYSLREHVAVCYTPHVREVSFCSAVGVCTIDGVPAPTLRVSLQPTMGPRAQDASIGQLAVTRRGARAAQALAIAARWEANRTLTLLGPPLGVLWPRGAAGQCAIADELEHLLAKSRYVHDVFVHCDADMPLIAVVCPNRDTVEYEWRHRTRDAAAASSSSSPLLLLHAQEQQQTQPSQLLVWSELVAFATPLILGDLRAICAQEGLPASHMPQLVHVYPHTFRAHSTFVTPFGKLRRENVCRYFGAVFAQLYRDVAGAEERAAVTAAAPVADAASGGEHSGGRIATPLLDSDGEYGGLSDHGSATATPGRASEQASNRNGDSNNGNNGSAAQRLRLQVPLTIDIGGTFCKFAYIVPPRHTHSRDNDKNNNGNDDDNDNDEEARLPPPPVALEHEASSLSERIGVRAFGFLRDRDAAEREWRACPASRVGTLRFGKVPTMQLPRLASYLAAVHATDVYAHDAARHVRATGGGAFKYAALARSTLGVTFDVVKEMDAVVRGLNLVLSIAPDSVFTVDGVTGERRPHRLHDDDDDANNDDHRDRHHRRHVSPFPYLLINIGSGISFIKCTSADGAYERVGGTPIGGATFWGLTRLLTHLTSWDEVQAIMRLDGPGDNTNVDLLVGDIYGFNARNLPAMLSPESVASSFGKYGTERFRGAAPHMSSPAEHFADDGMGEIAVSSTTTRTAMNVDTPTTRRARRRRHHVDASHSAHDSDSDDDDSDSNDDSDDSDGGTTRAAAHRRNGHGSHRTVVAAAAHATATTSAGMAAVGASAASATDAVAAAGHRRYASSDTTSHIGSSMDVVRSLLHMIAGNVTQLAYLHSKVHNVRHIFFAGGFVRNNAIVWRTISNTLAYWSGGACHAHFLEHDGYLGALGCAVTPPEATSSSGNGDDRVGDAAQ